MNEELLIIKEVFLSSWCEQMPAFIIFKREEDTGLSDPVRLSELCPQH